MGLRKRGTLIRSGLALWIMRHVPRTWLYWAVIQGWCYATMRWPKKSPDEIQLDDVCKMLDDSEPLTPPPGEQGV